MINSPASARTFPQDFDYSYLTEVLLDAGINWQNNSNFHPFDCIPADSSEKLTSSKAYNWAQKYLDDYAITADKLLEHSVDGLGLSVTPGISLTNQSGAAAKYDGIAFNDYIWIVANLYSNWYIRFYARSTGQGESIPHYTGKSRNIERAGFTTGEIDQSVLGYRNDWLNVEFGRSREIWGTQTEDNVLLAGNSPAYERLMVQMTYRRFSYRWFHAFLESKVSTENINVNRYLVGRALEYRNHRNLILSLGEVSVYSGPNRPVDWSFLNPFAVHIEIEQNKRENYLWRNQSNDMLFFNFDWLPKPSLRLSGTFVIDEIQIDKKAREDGDANGLAYFGRFAWTPLREHIGATLFGYYLRIDSYTMQHQYGFTNLVTRGEIIGHPIGNDADEIAIGFRSTFNFKAIIELKIGQRRWGDNSLLINPYTPYDLHTKFPFPLGHVRKNKHIALKILHHLNKNLSFTFNGHFDIENSGLESELQMVTLSVRYQLPLHWLL